MIAEADALAPTNPFDVLSNNTRPAEIADILTANVDAPGP
jgi:hypothetical protein